MQYKSVYWNFMNILGNSTVNRTKMHKLSLIFSDHSRIYNDVQLIAFEYDWFTFSLIHTLIWALVLIKATIFLFYFKFDFLACCFIANCQISTDLLELVDQLLWLPFSTIWINQTKLNWTCTKTSTSFSWINQTK